MTNFQQHNFPATVDYECSTGHYVGLSQQDGYAYYRFFNLLTQSPGIRVFSREEAWDSVVRVAITCPLLMELKLQELGE